MENKGVSAAFFTLLEEILVYIKTINEQGAKAFQTGNYELVAELTEKAAQASGLREKLKALQLEWANLFPIKCIKREKVEHFLVNF